MGHISRRHFLRRSGLLLATTAAACGHDGSRRAPLQAVVVGSGFAGSVAALRLGEAGIATIILERGQQWPDGGDGVFPTLQAPDERGTWFGDIDALDGRTAISRYAGLIERVTGDTLDAVCAASVGGGSVVYGGVLLEPREAQFAAVLPNLDYAQMHEVYYPRVLAEIGATPIPDDVLAAAPYFAQRAFLETAAKAGFTTALGPVGFDWDVIREELAGQRPAAASAGEYIFGCNSGAKLTTDKSYLRDALATGSVELRAQHEVLLITERPGGGYELEVRVIDPLGAELDRYELEADVLFLAAGSLNTTKLLLKSQGAGAMSGGNDRVGQGWGSNGDQIFVEASPLPVSGAQGGPGSAIAYDDGPEGAVTFMHSPANVPLALQVQLAMTPPQTRGRVDYDATSDTLSLTWPEPPDSPTIAARRASFERLLSASGGTDLTRLSLQNGKPLIWHPLGGVLMGEATDLEGRLDGYEDLFVIDGSLLPGSAGGANPALTIAANAERIMERVIAGLEDR